MKRIILSTVAALSLCLSASAASIITQWNFNDNDGSSSTGTLVPSIGSGTATTVGTVTTTYNTPAGSSDPLGADVNNSAWRMSANWPAQGSGNKTCGVQLNISTVGSQNITLAWDQANSNTANKYYRVQYSIDNGATWVDKDVIVNNAGANWNNPIATVSFATIPGANNNPNFGVRIVSELQSTAVGGAASYVGVVSGYSSGGVLRLDMVTFSGDAASGQVNILTDPTNAVVAVGQAASFSVTAAGGTTPILYQWRKNSALITDATNAVYALAAAQHTDAGSYDVIVTNSVNSRTSAVATLTVRDPLSLAWTGLNGATWDTSTVSWVNTNSLLDTAYSDGDYALFDIRGNAAATVNLAASFTPSSVTVDADFDYVLRSDFGGKIAGTTGLTKRGAGTLTLDTDNSYAGPTVIQAGTVQLGVADTHGLIGSGSITNNGALVFNRTDSFALANNITGSGSLTNLNKSGTTVTLTGENVYNGPIAAKSGLLLLLGHHTINSTDVFITPSAATGLAGATRFGISGGVTGSAGTTLHMSGTTATPDVRCNFYSTSDTNTWNGPIIVDGTGNNTFQSDNSGTQLRINGNVTGSLANPGSLLLRGSSGFGVLNGTVNLPNAFVNKTDAGATWVINSTGNSWLATVLAQGTLRLGANNALPTGITLQHGQAGTTTSTLDLGGFNQQLAILQDGGGTEIIGNSSTVSDSTLTVGSGLFSGVIQDALATGGTRKTAFTLNGTTLTLAGVNTYSGETTVLAGILSLSGSGDFPNSPVINLAGGNLDVTARFDASLNLGAAQTLKGNGTFTVTGNVTSSGTIELKVNKAGGVVSNDKLAVSGQLNYGGTLKLDLSGQALNWTDTITAFAAGTYGGGLAAIEPAVPAPGATWDTSTLATDGKLRVYGPPTFTSTVVSGGSIGLSGLGGPAFGTFSVLTSTNVAALAANWTPIQTGAFDGSGNFSVTIPITPGEPRRFYKLQMP